MLFLYILIIIVSLYIILLIWHSNRLNNNNKKLESVVLKIAVSRVNERSPMVAEQVYSALHGLKNNYSFLDFLLAKPKPRFSLEIANINNLIQFFIWTPKKYKNVIESQIYSQYPDVEISEVSDYAKDVLDVFECNFPKNKNSDNVLAPIEDTVKSVKSSNLVYKNIVTTELNLSNYNVYPIKRYRQFEDKLTGTATETLAGITATFSKLNALDEKIFLQIAVEASPSSWMKKGLKILKLLNSSLFNNVPFLKSFLVSVYSERNFVKKIFYTPFYLLFFVLRIFFSSKVSDDNNPSLEDKLSGNYDSETPNMAALNKITKLSFDANIRIVYIPRLENSDLALVKLNEIASSFQQFTLPNLNSIEIKKINKNNVQIFNRYLKRMVVNPMVLNTEELATLYHMPSKDVGTPNIFWVNSRSLEPPNNLPVVGSIPDDELNIIGESNFRGYRQRFGIKTIDRRRHIYIIGKTGMGKSVLLENMIHSDVLQKKGLAVIDPHGDLAESVLDFIPPYRTNDVVILDPSDSSHPFAFNMLESGEDSQKRSLIASGLLGVFKKMYSDSWGPRLEHILRNCLLALAENSNTSMLGIMRMLVDKDYRRKIVSGVSNPMVKSFWLDEFEKWPERQRTEAISPIQNKVGQFLSSPLIRNIVGQVKSTVNIRFMMDTGKIIIVNLSKGKIGEDNSSLLGSMLITKFQLDAMSRADMAEKDRKDFYLYVDEFQNFATDAFATILSEARKYKLNLVMANQYIAQMPDEVRDAVFGNVGSMLSFQVGFDDAEYFSNQFSEEVLSNDIVSLAKYNCYSKLMIDGMPSKTFSFSTLPPSKTESDSERKAKIIRLSRERYCTPRDVVEDKVKRWMESGGEGKTTKLGTSKK